MLAPLYDGDLAALRRFDCAPAKVAGVPCVVSNTGWSKEAGFEIYPLGSERCLELWDAIVAAGEPHGLLVTGAEHHARGRAGHHGHAVQDELGHDRARGGLESMLDLDGATSWAATRCSPSGARGSARRTIGLVADGRAGAVPRGVLAGARRRTATTAGVARWAVFSYALERNIAIALVDAAVGDADELVLRAPDGDRDGARPPDPVRVSARSLD